MSEIYGNNYNLDDEIEFLVFNINGIRFGVETGQISGILKTDDEELKDFKVSWFHEKLSFRDKYVQYREPRVLIIKDGETTGIIIDNMEDIIKITTDSILPIPKLIEICSDSGTIWGATIRDNEIILLVDFYKLKGKNIKES